MAKWLPPHGFTGTVHQMDAKVGGSWRMSFTNFTNGHAHSFGGKYLELVPGERLRYTSAFDDPNLPGEMQITVSLKAVACGTEVSIVQEGMKRMLAGVRVRFRGLRLARMQGIPDKDVKKANACSGVTMPVKTVTSLAGLPL